MRADIESGPSVQGVRFALLAATAVAALLSALAIVMTLTLAAPARGRVLALLRTLGAPPRIATSLALWEIGPPAVAAVIAGTLFGALVPLVVLAGVDLRSFTGSTVQPAYQADAATLAADARRLRAARRAVHRRSHCSSRGACAPRARCAPWRKDRTMADAVSGTEAGADILCVDLVRIFKVLGGGGPGVEVQALQGLNLRVDPGELVAVSALRARASRRSCRSSRASTSRPRASRGSPGTTCSR